MCIHINNAQRQRAITLKQIVLYSLRDWRENLKRQTYIKCKKMWTNFKPPFPVPNLCCRISKKNIFRHSRTTFFIPNDLDTIFHYFFYLPMPGRFCWTLISYQGTRHWNLTYIFNPFPPTFTKVNRKKAYNNT